MRFKDKDDHQLGEGDRRKQFFASFYFLICFAVEFAGTTRTLLYTYDSLNASKTYTIDVHF
jgi:hypothetical protein